jgi:hypothetical protein
MENAWNSEPEMSGLCSLITENELSGLGEAGIKVPEEVVDKVKETG